MVIRDYRATDQDLGVMATLADIESSAICTVTVPANTQFSYNEVCEIICGYAGAGSGTLTASGTVNGTAWSNTWTITGARGGIGYEFPAFDAGSTVTITLSAAGVLAFLIVGFIPK